MHIFLAFYVFSSAINNGDLYASFGFSSRPTLMGLFLFFQAIWSPIDKVSRTNKSRPVCSHFAPSETSLTTSYIPTHTPRF